MYLIVRTAFLVLFLVSTSSLADENLYQFGAMVGGSYHTLDDPDGKTDPSSGFRPLNLIFTYNYGRDKRIFVEGYKFEYSLNSDLDKIGQRVDSTGLGVSWQNKFRITKNIKPWLGIGLGYSRNKFRVRETIDIDGYKDIVYDNRENDYFLLIANLSTLHAINDDFDLIFHADIQGSTNKEYIGASIFVGLLY